MSTKFTFNPFTSNFDAVSLVTIGAPANGLAISAAQVLTLGLASSTLTGALSSTDWNTFNNKADSNLDNLTAPTLISQDLVTASDNSQNLGSTTIRWSNLFALQAKASNASPLVDLVNGRLNTGAGSVTLVWPSRILADSVGNAVLDWQAKALQDGSGLPKFSWAGSDLDASTHLIHNVVDPVSAQDAATKNYVDGNFANRALSNLTNPTSVNQTLQVSATNTFDLGSSSAYWQIGFIHLLKQDNSTAYIELGATSSLRDSAGTKSVDWANRQLASGATVKLDWSGTDVSLNTRKLTNVVDPTNPQDAATKAYVDAGHVAPTIQKFTSGSGTYTKPANVKYLRVQMAGGGGGGAASGSTAGTNGTNGTDTTFGTSLLTAGGGLGGNYADIGAQGGNPIVSSPAVDVASSQGGAGQGYSQGLVGAYFAGPIGGDTPYFGGGARLGSALANGAAGEPNSGGGGQGGGTGAAAANNSGAGGGAGAYVEALITAPSATYAYAVGPAGNGGGTPGTSGFTGAQGGSGVIIVTEYY